MQQCLSARVERNVLYRTLLDALNGMLILDNVTLRKMQRFAPHLGAMDLRKPRTVSRNLTIPPPVIATIAAWLHGTD